MKRIAARPASSHRFKGATPTLNVGRHIIPTLVNDREHRAPKLVDLIKEGLT